LIQDHVAAEQQNSGLHSKPAGRDESFQRAQILTVPQFLARDTAHMLSTLCAIARPSVRLSCHTGGSVKTVEVTIVNLYPTVAPSL